jgi:hypothetical protein
MVVYSCKKCGELNYPTPHASWNIAGFGAKCEKCEVTITLEKGELKNKNRFILVHKTVGDPTEDESRTRTFSLSLPWFEAW